MLLLLGRAWGATTTEGLLIYSLDHQVVFDPYDLEMDITPSSVRKTLEKKEYSSSLMLAFRLNEKDLIQEVIESIPVSDGNIVFFIRLRDLQSNIPVENPPHQNILLSLMNITWKTFRKSPVILQLFTKKKDLSKE